MYPEDGVGATGGAELADDGKEEYGGGGPAAYIDVGLIIDPVFTLRSVGMAAG